VPAATDLELRLVTRPIAPLTQAYWFSLVTQTASGYPQIQAAQAYELAAGALVGVFIYQASGAPVNIRIAALSVVALSGAKGDTGAVGPAGPSGASTFVSGVGAPGAGVGVNGSVYLDTASLEMWGPKAAGAWPGTAFARLMPLTPNYAQVKTG
jgi:hypothetical protein